MRSASRDVTPPRAPRPEGVNGVAFSASPGRGKSESGSHPAQQEASKMLLAQQGIAAAMTLPLQYMLSRNGSGALDALPKGLQAMGSLGSNGNGNVHLPADFLCEDSDEEDDRDTTDADSSRGVVLPTAPADATGEAQALFSGPCRHCGATCSPQWRQGPEDKPVLCNACGVRYRRRKALDPKVAKPAWSCPFPALMPGMHHPGSGMILMSMPLPAINVGAPGAAGATFAAAHGLTMMAPSSISGSPLAAVAFGHALAMHPLQMAFAYPSFLGANFHHLMGVGGPATASPGSPARANSPTQLPADSAATGGVAVATPPATGGRRPPKKTAACKLRAAAAAAMSQGSSHGLAAPAESTDTVSGGRARARSRADSCARGPSGRKRPLELELDEVASAAQRTSGRARRARVLFTPTGQEVPQRSRRLGPGVAELEWERAEYGYGAATGDEASDEYSEGVTGLDILCDAAEELRAEDEVISAPRHVAPCRAVRGVGPSNPALFAKYYAKPSSSGLHVQQPPPLPSQPPQQQQHDEGAGDNGGEQGGDTTPMYRSPAMETAGAAGSPFHGYWGSSSQAPTDVQPAAPVSECDGSQPGSRAASPICPSEVAESENGSAQIEDNAPHNPTEARLPSFDAAASNSNLHGDVMETVEVERTASTCSGPPAGLMRPSSAPVARVGCSTNSAGHAGTRRMSNLSGLAPRPSSATYSYSAGKSKANEPLAASRANKGATASPLSRQASGISKRRSSGRQKSMLRQMNGAAVAETALEASSEGATVVVTVTNRKGGRARKGNGKVRGRSATPTMGFGAATERVFLGVEAAAATTVSV